MTPKLSVGLPVYNGERYLVQALESILAQDFQDFELIISDNASADGTAAICRRYAERDTRIRYFRAETNHSGARNLNKVFELARARYFKWAAHDDICLPGFFRRCVNILDSAPPSVVLVYPRTQAIDESGNLLEWYSESLEAKHPRPHQRLSRVLRQFDGLSAQYGMMRAEALKKTRLFDETIAAEDFVLLAELSMLGEFWEIPEKLFQRRIHPAMSSKASRPKKRYGIHISPMMRLGYEFVRSAWRLPLAPEDRWRCCLTAPSVWYVREFRNWGGRQKSRLFRSIGFNQASRVRSV